MDIKIAMLCLKLNPDLIFSRSYHYKKPIAYKMRLKFIQEIIICSNMKENLTDEFLFSVLNSEIFLESVLSFLK